MIPALVPTLPATPIAVVPEPPPGLVERAVYLASELLWFLAIVAAIPVAVLVVGIPLALVVKLVLYLLGWS